MAGKVKTNRPEEWAFADRAQMLAGTLLCVPFGSMVFPVIWFILLVTGELGKGHRRTAAIKPKSEEL